MNTKFAFDKIVRSVYWLVPVFIIRFVLKYAFEPKPFFYNETLYNNSFLIAQMYTFIIVLCIVAFLSVRYKLTWKKLAIDKNISRFLLLLLTLIAWNYFFTDYNFYFNQWYKWDRILLALFSIGSIFYPLFLLPALLQICLIRYQYIFPIGGYSFLDQTMPFELLAISISFIIVLLIIKSFNTTFNKSHPLPQNNHLFVLLICVLSACYFYAGVAKAHISPHGFEWAFENHLSHNIIAMSNRGWLNQYPQIAQFVMNHEQSFDGLGQITMLLGELVFVFVLLSRQLSVVLISLMLLLHLTIFVINGAFFWIWMITDIGFIILIRNYSKEFNFTNALMGICTIWLVGTICPVPKLGWFDGPIDNRFQLIANDSIELSEASLSPYTRHFLHGNFLPTVDAKTINPGSLVYDYQQYKKALGCNDTIDVNQYYNEFGNNKFVASQKEKMKEFLLAYMHQSKPNPLHFLQPPSYWNAQNTCAFQ